MYVGRLRFVVVIARALQVDPLPRSEIINVIYGEWIAGGLCKLLANMYSSAINQVK